jgi:hypothetical protein
MSAVLVSVSNFSRYDGKVDLHILFARQIRPHPAAKSSLLKDRMSPGVDSQSGWFLGEELKGLSQAHTNVLEPNECDLYY